MMGPAQLTTFRLGKDTYGIDVMRVQEVTGSIPITRIPKAPDHILGLVNLRGQIATAIGLYQLFGVKPEAGTDQNMNVICRVEDSLLALYVDSIGEVIDAAETEFEQLPSTVNGTLSKFVGGVLKTKDSLVSLVDLDKLAAELK